MKTISLNLDASGNVQTPAAGAGVIVQYVSTGDEIAITWLDEGEQQRGTVRRAGVGQKFIPGFMFAGLRIVGTANAAVDLLIAENGRADADLLDAITVENSADNPVQVTIVEPVELTASSVTITADGGAVSAAAPLPVREVLSATLTNVAPIAVTAAQTVVLAASATRRGFWVRNVDDADAIALVGNGGTFANAAIVVQPGEERVIETAPGAAWYAICDTGGAAQLNVLRW